MTVNSFEREESNANVDSAQYYIDSDGSFKFISPILASSNFDGSIPIFEGTVYADELESGMLIQLSDSQYYPIIDIFKDDPDLEDDPSDIITVNYIDANTETQTISFDSSDSIEVRYENWSEKYLGSQGWALTYGGNAIFANVGVRGRIEATEGFLENLGITGDISIESSGSISIGNNPGTSGSPGIIINNTGIFAYDDSENQTISIDATTGQIIIGGVPGDDLATQDDLDGYIPSGSAAFDINTNATTIDGGKITTGSILADKINTNNLFVQNLISFSTTSASRIKILDINDQRHKLQFETGWTREVVPAFIGSSTYVNPNVGFGGSTMGVEIYAGLLNLGVTYSPANIRLLSRSFDSSGLERTINYEADAHQFRSLTSGANSIFSVSGFSIIDIGNTANPPDGVKQFGIRMSPVSGFNITGPVTFTGNVNGTFVGNGSGLTGVGSPIVISTSGPSNPSAYQDNTVWYVI